MNYFTPELYERTNAEDIDEAMAATEQWRAASRAYCEHLARIRPRLPLAVLRFVDRVFLHDFEIFGLALARDPKPVGVAVPAPEIGILFARDGKSLYVLNYFIEDPPEIVGASLPDRLRTTPATWLYDEFDLVGEDRYSHEIFLSNGKLIKLVFSDFHYTGFDRSAASPRPAGDPIGELVPI